MPEIDLKPREIIFKFVFDSINKCILASAITIAGLYLFGQKKSIFRFPYSNKICGWLLAAIGILLLCWVILELVLKIQEIIETKLNYITHFPKRVISCVVALSFVGLNFIISFLMLMMFWVFIAQGMHLT
jgi:hypothetical protein